MKGHRREGREKVLSSQFSVLSPQSSVLIPHQARNVANNKPHSFHTIIGSWNRRIYNLNVINMTQTQTIHLTECADLFSESNKLDSEVRECLFTYFLKTTTNFHNADMQFNPLFGALCWSYTLGGISMIANKPKWLHCSNFPYVLYAYTLIFIQGTCLHIYR